MESTIMRVFKESCDMDENSMRLLTAALTRALTPYTRSRPSLISIRANELYNLLSGCGNINTIITDDADHAVIHYHTLRPSEALKLNGTLYTSAVSYPMYLGVSVFGRCVLLELFSEPPLIDGITNPTLTTNPTLATEI